MKTTFSNILYRVQWKGVHKEKYSKSPTEIELDTYSTTFADVIIVARSSVFYRTKKKEKYAYLTYGRKVL